VTQERKNSEPMRIGAMFFLLLSKHHMAGIEAGCLIAKPPALSRHFAQLIFNPEDGGDTYLRNSVHIRSTWRYIP
jgi:hypothetical protein